MIPIKPSTTHGLTAAEVRERQQDGRVNAAKNTVTKPLSRIFIDNICTLFNLVNAIIAAALITVGSYHNLLFLLIVFCNTVIGIFQEIRSKRTLERLSLLCTAKATVRRDGEEQVIPAAEIVVDDVILFRNGDQISVDACVTNGEAEVNESLLTGEIDPILKTAGATLLSGSFVVSGQCEAIVEKVGEESYASKLAAEAKKYKRLHSQLMVSINKIIRFTSCFMIPLAALKLLSDWWGGTFELKSSVTATAGALLGMMPQGLMLLTTVALVVGVLKLARKNTLVRELYSIETLSRVSLLCLDKIGTITKGTMSVTEVIPLDDSCSEEECRTLIASAIHAIGDNNATADAVKQYCELHGASPAYTAVKVHPFSSARKWSAAAFEEVGSVFIGAYDRLLTNAPSDRMRELEDSGKRLLLVARQDGTAIDTVGDALTPVAMIVLEDEIRDNAKEILAFFRREDVQLRVISGDNPRTVSAIAQKAGLENADRFIDASTLQTEEELREAAKYYVVFGRVMPEQKRTLVRLFKEQGHTVAMTGDGVNDVPALKEADCSIAVAAGSDAAKQVSQLVLLDSDFASLPTVVMEGRRVVNNITRTASLFLVKTVMSFLLTVCDILIPGVSYSFQPIHLTMVGLFAESIPGFFLTLEPCRERIKGHFFNKVLSSAVPSAVIIVLGVIIAQLVLQPALGLSSDLTNMLCVYFTGTAWLVQLYRVCQPFSMARRILWILMVICFYTGTALMAVIVPLLAQFGLQVKGVFLLPTAEMIRTIVIAAVLTFVLDYVLVRISRRIWPAEKS